MNVNEQIKTNKTNKQLNKIVVINTNKQIDSLINYFSD